MIRSNSRVCLLLCLIGGAAFAQKSALRVTEPAPAKDGTIFTREPAITIHGTLDWTGGDRRILWKSSCGFRDLAAVTLTADGKTLQWNSTAPVPLRPGVNHVEIRALGQPGAAAFVNIFYTPKTAPAPTPMGTTILRGKQIAYQAIDGRALYQGDQILGSAADVAGGRFRGRFASGGWPNLRTQSATLAPNYASTTGLWPVVNGVVRVPYKSTGVNATNLGNAITESNTQLSGVVQWVPATGSDTNRVNFNFDPEDFGGGCESNVGMAGGTQTIGGSVNCDTGTILHEMGHALGLFHENSRADRDGYVNYIEANIDKPQYSNFDIYDSGVDSGLYNWASIMEYGPFEFARDGVSTVLETIPAGMVLGTDLPQYTTGDLDGIMRLYGRVPTAITVDTNPTGLTVVVDGTSCVGGSTCVFSNWSLGSQHTLTVPTDSHGQTLQTLSQQAYIFGRWNAGSSGQQSVNITVAAGDGTLLKPKTSPLVTAYLADFIPIHPYSPVVAPSNAGTISTTPSPSTMYLNNVLTSYYQDRQLVKLTVTANSGYAFYNWANLSLYNLYSNPYTFPIQANFDFYDFDTEYPATAVLTTDPVTDVEAASPDIGAENTFPGFAITVLDSGGNDVSTGYTPQRFTPSVDGSKFAAGTQLTLCASYLNSGGACPVTPAPQVPVTTNISYLFSNWTGSATASTDALNITVPVSGTSTYTANYTPSFRTIVVPSIYCGNTGVSTTTPNSNSSGTGGNLDAFFTSGSTNFTAGAGTSGLTFAGWSQDLSSYGATNPLAYNLSGQVIGTANFNVTTTPLAITSVSPAAPAVTSGAFDLTVNGTGFTTNGSVTYAYFLNPVNGYFEFPAFTLVSPTQLTIHLDAGDLAVPGYYQIAVLNAVSGGCNPSVFYTFLVANSAGAPQFTITKMHTGNFSPGQQNAPYTVSIQNSGTGPTTSTVTVTEAVPSGETLVSMQGTGWSCTGTTCTTSNSLAAGLFYPGITVTVNVAANATSPQVNSVTVSGGGADAATATDSTTLGSVTLQSIAITPANPTILTGGTQQFNATGTYSDNSTLNLTNSVAWASTNTSVATIASGGLATAKGTGTSTIGATLNSISGSTLLTVTAPILQSIAVTPANPSIAKGTTLQFTATGTYTDTSTKNLTASVTWGSSNGATASISSGLATALAVGTTTISAVSGAIQGSTALTVTGPALVSIAVTPANSSILTGGTQQFTATGTYSDNSTQILASNVVTWTSSPTAEATINISGLATGVGAGVTTITATSGAVQGSAGLTVLTRCDITQNGTTDVSDVANILNQVLGLTPARNDLNGDGPVNVLDVQIVVNAVLTSVCAAR